MADGILGGDWGGRPELSESTGEADAGGPAFGPGMGADANSGRWGFPPEDAGQFEPPFLL